MHSKLKTNIHTCKKNIIHQHEKFHVLVNRRKNKQTLKNNSKLRYKTLKERQNYLTDQLKLIIFLIWFMLQQNKWKIRKYKIESQIEVTTLNIMTKNLIFHMRKVTEN